MSAVDAVVVKMMIIVVIAAIPPRKGNTMPGLSFGVNNIIFILIRALAVGVMHVVCSLMLIMGIIIQKRLFTLSFPGIVGALSLSTAFHGFYNLLVSEPGIPTYIGYTMPILSAVALYFPYRTLKRQEAQKAAGAYDRKAESPGAAP